MKVIINREIEIDTPRTPNWIFVNLRDTSSDNKISIADFSDEQLKKIGEEWTRELIRRAQIIRQDQKQL